eukprot:scaffold27.g5975.t1
MPAHATRSACAAARTRHAPFQQSFRGRRRLQPGRVSGSPAAVLDARQVIEALIERRDLAEEQAEQALALLVDGGQPAQIAAFLVLLRAKGETAAEVAGMAKALRALSVHPHPNHPTPPHPCAAPPHPTPPLLDIVGTGGDSIGSVNISTGATVVAAAAGAKVAKHGSRSVSSLCGSADVLEALGVAVELGPAGVGACLDRAGVGFMFAPYYLPVMKAVVPVRKALGVRTAFNLMGPMLNPARAQYGLVGVYSTSVSHLMADSLQVPAVVECVSAVSLGRLGMKKALVVHSMGLDELTPMGPADVVEVTQGGKRHYSLEPLDLGIPRCAVEDLAGGDATLNASILLDVFGGTRGPVADALCLNAGVALAAAQVVADAREGVAMAQEAQRTGRAGDTMRAWRETSQEARAAELAAGAA